MGFQVLSVHDKTKQKLDFLRNQLKKEYSKDFRISQKISYDYMINVLIDKVGNLNVAKKEPSENNAMENNNGKEIN